LLAYLPLHGQIELLICWSRWRGRIYCGFSTFVLEIIWLSLPGKSLGLEGIIGIESSQRGVNAAAITIAAEGMTLILYAFLTGLCLRALAGLVVAIPLVVFAPRRPC
jgi:hypothetical protein